MTGPHIPHPIARVLLIAAAGLSAVPALGQRAAAPGVGEIITTEWAYPTGDRATSVILLERLMPREARVNTDFEYQMRLTNLAGREIQNLVLTEQFPAGFTPQSTSPRVAYDRAQRRGTWRWARLGPGASELIRVQGRADQATTLNLCATITFADTFCATVPVVEPRLRLVKSAPREVLICDPIPLTFVVSNPGSGVVRNVRISDRLPAGLETADGRNTLMLDAGDLAAGESREVTASLRATRTGQFTNAAEARDDSGLTATAAATTVVRQPVLVVSKSGPDVRFIGRPAAFEITVQNTGDAPARDTILTDPIPAGAEFIAAPGGQLMGDRVVWNLGTLAPGATTTVRVTLNPTALGPLRNTATAEAYCARATGTATLEVRGISAILLEVVDHPDPIEVGGQVTYTIEVTNQGSATATGIVIDCLLQPEMKYVSATAPVAARVEGQRIQFAPLPALAPKAKALYTVIAEGLSVGDTRFKVTLETDQTTSPVEETESTHVY